MIILPQFIRKQKSFNTFILLILEFTSKKSANKTKKLIILSQHNSLVQSKINTVKECKHIAVNLQIFYFNYKSSLTKRSLKFRMFFPYISESKKDFKAANHITEKSEMHIFGHQHTCILIHCTLIPLPG